MAQRIAIIHVQLSKASAYERGQFTIEKGMKRVKSSLDRSFPSSSLDSPVASRALPACDMLRLDLFKLRPIFHSALTPTTHLRNILRLATQGFLQRTQQCLF